MAEHSRVGIVGTGLMGASLGAALRSRPNPPEIVGFSGTTGDAGRARELGFLDRAVDRLEEAVAGAEVVVLATPLDAAVELIGRLGLLLGPEVLVTDVVSLKQPLVETARVAGLADRFVGAHPFVGGTGSGPDAAREDLFRGAPVFLTPGDAPESMVARARAFWEGVGAVVEVLDAAEHDRRMVRLSHLPQLTANLLANHWYERGLSPADRGPGARDMTRLAASSPEMWASLIRAASDDVATELRALEAAFGVLARSIEDPASASDAVTRLMNTTRDWLDSRKVAEPQP